MQEENNVTPETVQEPEKLTIPEQTPQCVREPFCRFNLNTLLTLLLLAGLIVLYILHFTAGRSSQPPAMPLAKADGKSLSVVFVNIDSLNANYEYVKVLRRDLESTGKKLQTEVLSEKTALEKEAADFQKQMGANAITEERARVVYEALMQKQQALMQKQEHYTQLVAEQEMNMNLRLVDSVTAFLKRFNRSYGFDYILGYKTGGEILVSNDTLDITHQVLEALNTEYAARKK